MNWTQLIYQYAFGGAFFAITMYLCFRPGASDLSNKSDRKAFIYALVGFAGYLAMHICWIILVSR
jgi:drug/metabolite transporter (DMT)-like permease